MLQSQYAGLELEPYVELEFTDGREQDIYIVRRVPRHLKKITRGDVYKRQAKCLLYAINGGVDEKTKQQVGPQYQPITSEYLDYDEVIAKYDKMMDWLAHLYVGTLNMIDVYKRQTYLSVFTKNIICLKIRLFRIIRPIRSRGSEQDQCHLLWK